MMGGAGVFLTGAPGSGKTYVLNQFTRRAKAAGKRVAVTASTGIAASHIGGTTIHSWSGLGIVDRLMAEDLRRLGGSHKLLKRYNATDVLVIDEVSMLHGQRLDMVNQLAKLLRGSEEPFGGLQVILVGDLYQLPPVSRGAVSFDFAHLSAAWAEFNPQICYLSEQHRQQGDDALLQILEAMRLDEVSEEHGRLLQERLSQTPPDGSAVTRLYAHNLDVDAINQRHLAALDGPSRRYEMTAKGGRAKIEQLSKSLLAPELLELKIGAEVMFVANNFQEGFVNGSRGRVVEFADAGPLVKLLDGRQITVEPHSWSLSEDDRVRAEISQVPLRLAWAITIHKSQGMSLDAAEVDLSRAFTPGMGYVALSRVRGLSGLYLKGINATAMVMHPAVHELDQTLRQTSSQLASQTDDIGDEAEPESTRTAAAQAAALSPADEQLFTKLKAWRSRRAQADSVPAYIIAHNTALSAVAAAKPTSARQLLALPGFGSRKVEAFGDEILAVVAGHAQAV